MRLELTRDTPLPPQFDLILGILSTFNYYLRLEMN